MRKIKTLIIIVALLLCQGGTFVVDPTKNAVWHNEKGMSFLELKHYGAAMQEFQIAILLNPESEASSAFYNNLGMTYYKIGDYKSSELNFQRAFELKPFYIEYYKNYINSYEKRNLLGNLSVQMTNTLIKDESDIQALLMLGLVHQKLGNKELAAGYLRKFIYLAPDLSISNQLKRLVKELEK